MRVAAIDIGTNTVLLLIAEIESGEFTVLTDDHAIARLGEGVDKTGIISEEAYDRLRSKLTEHAITIEHYLPLHISAVATSAMRDAKNSAEIVRRAKLDTGIEIEIIDGAEEARWTYLGSIGALSLPAANPLVVLDIGGGSTEIAHGTHTSFTSGSSAQIGAVRLTERAQLDDLSVEDACQMVRDAFGPIDAPRGATLIAVAGTPTSLAAIDLGLQTFDAQKIHGHRLSKEVVSRILEEIWDMTSDEIVEAYPAVNPGRADILAAGTAILFTAMTMLDAQECVVSTRGLRYGVALRAATRG
jgi:exopolyphosphatase/guanosine-5'-triphosphate,3'-diphosphate pyrophosphatase